MKLCNKNKSQAETSSYTFKTISNWTLSHHQDHQTVREYFSVLSSLLQKPFGENLVEDMLNIDQHLVGPISLLQWSIPSGLSWFIL